MLSVLKLGGALLTDKTRPHSLRTELLAAIAADIRRARDAGLLDALILVHGVGSYGHLPVLEHQLHRGWQSPRQLLPLAQTQSQVMLLRTAVVAALQAEGLPAVLMMPSSSMTALDFRPHRQAFEAIPGFLRLRMIPVLGSDVLAEETVGFSVYSGDDLSVDLARHFQADQLLFATDVPGVYTADPRQHADASLLPEIHLSHLATAQLSERALDVSGAMAGKLQAIARCADRLAAGMETRIFSLKPPANLGQTLQNPAIGTRVLP